MPVGARRAVPSLVAWSVAAVVAVAVASWGVALVGRSVTDSRPAPLSAAQVEERLAAGSAPAEATSTTTTEPVGAGDAPGPGDPTPTTGPSPSSPGSTIILGGTDVVPDPGPGASTPTTAAPSTPPEPAPTPPTGETRTYSVAGGTVALRFEPTGVTVVYANPAAGFEVEVEPEHGTGVRVEFESDGHRSRVTGWWEGGPQERVEERPHDDD